MLGVVGLLAGALVVFAFYTTRGAAESADRFLRTLAAQHYAQAYRLCAQEMKYQQSEDTFTKNAKRFGLDRFKSVQWRSREFVGGLAMLTGSMTTQSNETIDLQISLGKEKRVWKVRSIEIEPNGPVQPNPGS